MFAFIRYLITFININNATSSQIYLEGHHDCFVYKHFAIHDHVNYLSLLVLIITYYKIYFFKFMFNRENSGK